MKSGNSKCAAVVFCLGLLFTLMSVASCDSDDDSSAESGSADDDFLDDDPADDDDDAGDDDDFTDDADDDADDDSVDDDADDDAFPELDPSVCALAEPADLIGFDPEYEMLESGDWVWDKNYYLLTVFAMLSEAARIIAEDAGIDAISRQRDERIREASTDCAGDIQCVADAALWSDVEAQAAAEALAEAFAGARADLDLPGELLRSGAFHLHAGSSASQLVENAWLDTRAGLRQAFDSYARSLPVETMADIVDQTVADNPDPMPFYRPLLEIALAAMDYHGRDEAGRYEPMAQGENAAAIARIPDIDWDEYRFSVILVPGRGPDYEIPLHYTSKKRCDIAVERYEAGVAPFLLLSGGHVHPDGTAYCEAVEMKRYLMDTHGVPENAIFVDPYARHTTTNLRDASRLIFRYGLPWNKPALITTDLWQNIYISYLLMQRCRDELGYLPWRKLRALDYNDACLLPSPMTLYIDPCDPLDP